ncbi:uncharacterized protein ALTATR162_LOCUS5710 [Alternaria atra]|uniref:Uncharacterized protein n=1 Tax=Alternaria atra TaxID=119953 RepID=A0A8J2I185_9PLEO|nr:uncharacterized protein ALTATR162_LOCUS5710 [Alternaria atra]CAG5159974.1 unnamed protein product [Alternaria atra]
MPTRGGHGPREELIPEGFLWRPQGDSSPGSHFTRPSQTHGHSHRRTKSLRDPFPQGFPQSLQDGRRSNLHTSYIPEHAEFMQWRFLSLGEYPFDDAYYTDDVHGQAKQRDASFFDNPGDGAQSHSRVEGSSTSFRQTPYAVESKEEHYVFERSRGNGHSRSVSAPQNTTTHPDHGDKGAERYAHIPEHVREHPRFEEAAHAEEMVKKFREGDPRAELYKKLLKEITEEINKDIGEE